MCERRECVRRESVCEERKCVCGERVCVKEKGGLEWREKREKKVERVK